MVYPSGMILKEKRWERRLAWHGRTAIRGLSYFLVLMVTATSLTPKIVNLISTRLRCLIVSDCPIFSKVNFFQLPAHIPCIIMTPYMVSTACRAYYEEQSLERKIRKRGGNIRHYPWSELESPDVDQGVRLYRYIVGWVSGYCYQFDLDDPHKSNIHKTTVNLKLGMAYLF
jgi:hypothetical protein